MNTKELAKQVADASSVSEKHVREILDALLAGIVDTVTKGEEVSLPGFGKFKRKETAARQGRNPATGEAIEISASSKVAFTPAKALKDRL